ncbi:MAG: rRNA (cytosine1402-N4)-methyltransferase [Verrucomicrobiota bacterium]
MSEVLSALQPRAGGRYLDGTLGRAGHAVSILEASSPDGWLYGCDRDGEAIEAASRRLAEAGFAGRYELRRGNFSDLADWIPPDSCDGILFDLGVSTPQLESAGRGFSFQRDGPLDMRMDLREPLTAAAVVNGWPEAELARIFREYGDEPQARRVAKAIVRDRQGRRFETTVQLAGLIERLSPRHGRKTHPATRVFQALRMAVNDEVDSLKKALAAACPALKRHGRLVVMTFHSLEARILKEFGRQQTRDYVFDGDVDVPELRRPTVPVLRWIQRKALPPSAVEVAANPRSRSAQLRVLEKI